MAGFGYVPGVPLFYLEFPRTSTFEFCHERGLTALRNSSFEGLIRKVEGTSIIVDLINLLDPYVNR